MIATFICGTTEFDLTASPFAIGADFAPPPVAPTYQTAGGSSLNRTDGAELIGTKYNNRSWDFSVRILGGGLARNMERARALVSYLNNASSANPMYLDFSPSSLPEPLYGQFGAPLRYEIVTADAEILRGYGDSRMREQAIWLDIKMTVKPFAQGKQQRLASAKGGIVEDAFDKADGLARGVIVGDAATNLVTDPAMSALWSAYGTPVVRELTDPTQPYSDHAHHLVGDAAGDAVVINVGSLAIGTVYTASVYARVRSGTASLKVFKTVGPFTIYATLSIPVNTEGFVSVTWTQSATDTCYLGLFSNAGESYFELATLAAKPSFVAPITGDMLGNAWTGAADASTSTRAAGLMSLPIAADTWNWGQGSIVMVLQARSANTRTTDGYYFTTGATAIRAYFSSGGDQVVLTDNTNTATSAAQTYAVGDNLVLIFTWGPGGLNVYRAGANIATNATYTPPTPGTNIYLTTNTTAIAHLGDVIRGFTVYDIELTQAQVTAINTAAAAIAADDGRTDWTPWLWTKDGDDIVDNYNDATRNNWAVAAGVAGNCTAGLKARILNPGSGGIVADELFMSTFATPEYVAASNFIEFVNVNSGAIFDGHVFYFTRYTKYLVGKPVMGMITITDAATTDDIHITGSNSDGKIVQGSPVGIFYGYGRSDQVTFPTYVDLSILRSVSYYPGVSLEWVIAGLAHIYHAILFAGKIFHVTGLDYAAADGKTIYIADGFAMTDAGSENAMAGVEGVLPEFEPNAHNLIITLTYDFSGGNKGCIPDRALYFNPFFIIPRWSLL